MMHGKTPTKAEKAWMDAIVQLGCIVCRNQGYGYVPPAVHHIVSGSRRLGHMFTLPLCDPGHHQNAPKGSGEVSRHPNKAQFEAKYGTEMELLAQCQKLLGVEVTQIERNVVQFRVNAKEAA
jgi:hypothetical protein